jgi:ABC-type branched-subunit amino acid transport system ATPase component
MSAQLQIAEVSKSFGGVQAVSRVGLDVQQGQVLSVIGPNGAGKTCCSTRSPYHPTWCIVLEART